MPRLPPIKSPLNGKRQEVSKLKQNSGASCARRDTMDSIDFFTRSGQLWARNSIATEPFRIKGVNWYGMEMFDNPVLGGLTKQSLDTMLDFVSAQGFNAIRLAVSAKNVLNGNTLVPSVNQEENPEMFGLTYLQQLDYIINAAS